MQFRQITRANLQFSLHYTTNLNAVRTVMSFNPRARCACGVTHSRTLLSTLSEHFQEYRTRYCVGLIYTHIKVHTKRGLGTW